MPSEVIVSEIPDPSLLINQVLAQPFDAAAQQAIVDQIMQQAGVPRTGPICPQTVPLTAMHPLSVERQAQWSEAPSEKDLTGQIKLLEDCVERLVQEKAELTTKVQELKDMLPRGVKEGCEKLAEVYEREIERLNRQHRITDTDLDGYRSALERLASYRIVRFAVRVCGISEVLYGI